MINLDEFKSIGTHWIALYVNDNNIKYFDSFEVEHILNEIKKVIRISWQSYKIQAYGSLMCGSFCIGFIDFMLKGKSLVGYTNLFSHNDYDKNDKIIQK